MGAKGRLSLAARRLAKPLTSSARRAEGTVVIHAGGGSGCHFSLTSAAVASTSAPLKQLASYFPRATSSPQPASPQRHNTRPGSARNFSGNVVFNAPLSPNSTASGNAARISSSNGLGQRRRGSSTSASPRRKSTADCVSDAGTVRRSVCFVQFMHLPHDAAAGSSNARARNSIKQPLCST